MRQAIKVDSRFATAHRTAKVLGVSKSRTETLIKRARRFTDRLLDLRNSKAGQFVLNGHGKKESAATVIGKISERDAGTKISTAKPKRAKAKR